MIIDIHLGKNRNYTLSYQLQEHRVAERIWQRFKEKNFDFVSRTQFYNFGETVDEVKEKLNESILKIKELNPSIFVDSSDLNVLHRNFPDLLKTSTGDLKHWLLMFNYHLHHLEDITRYRNQRFSLAMHDGGEPLEDSDYDLFSPTRLYGHLYMNYPQTGKHLLEIMYDNDINIPKEHIVPTRILKNDLLAWFGKDQFTSTVNVYKRINVFCEFISHKLPYPVGDKRLAIGHICLGKVIGSIDIDQISKNRYIHSVETR
jgi:hypothetical protein